MCTDGAPSMVGSRKGFIGILNERATELNVPKDDLIVRMRTILLDDED